EQDNVSTSKRGVVRGLHYQHPNGQGKLVMVLAGEIFDVAVDIRRSSPTFGQWVAVTLGSATHRQLYVPSGFAHGFCATSELAIPWPTAEPLVSAKDGAARPLRAIPADALPP